MKVMLILQQTSLQLWCFHMVLLVNLLIENNYILQIRHLYDGEHFGEIALVANRNKRIASVIAVEPCELYKLDKVDFVRAILPYPDLLMKIERIANERMEETSALEER